MFGQVIYFPIPYLLYNSKINLPSSFVVFPVSFVHLVSVFLLCYLSVSSFMWLILSFFSRIIFKFGYSITRYLYGVIINEICRHRFRAPFLQSPNNIMLKKISVKKPAVISIDLCPSIELEYIFILI